MYYGDIQLGDTIDMKFTTRAFATGVPTTLAGSPTVAAYVGNGTTEITAGITLSVDFDSRTGLNNVRVVATSGNGYATATNIDIVVTAGTVGGTSVVGEVVCSFSIENRATNWAKVANPTSTVGLSGTTVGVVTLVNTLTTYTGNTPQTGDSFARIGANGAGLTNIDLPDQTMNITGNITGNLSGSVGSVTGAVGSVTGAVGSVTGNVGGNVVGSVASVTGNVGGNVTGSVGSVVGAVGSVTGNVGGNVTGSVGSVTGNIGGNVNGNVVGSVGSVVAGVTITVNNDKTGYALTAAYDAAKTAAQAGDEMDLVDAPNPTAIAAIQAGLALAATALSTAVWTNGRAANLDNLNATISSVLSAIAALNNLSAAQVNTEVNDVINVDTKGELAAVPAANASLGDKLTFIEMKIRNKETQNATDATISNTSGAAIGTAPVTDAAGVFTKGKYV